MEILLIVQPVYWLVFFSPLPLLQRFKCSVYRRYNDFVVFHEMLLQKFPYRMVPALPPKRMLGGKSGSVFWLEGSRCKRDQDDTVENKCLKDWKSLLLLGSENNSEAVIHNLEVWIIAILEILYMWNINVKIQCCFFFLHGRLVSNDFSGKIWGVILHKSMAELQLFFFYENRLWCSVLWCRQCRIAVEQL